MKELRYSNRKDLDHKVKVHNATLIRDYTIKSKSLKCISSVEAFNENRFRKADKIGITIYFPTKENPTHIATEIFNTSIGTKEFGRQIKRIEKELLKKVK